MLQIAFVSLCVLQCFDADDRAAAALMDGEIVHCCQCCVICACVRMPVRVHPAATPLMQASGRTRLWSTTHADMQMISMQSHTSLIRVLAQVC